MAIKVQLPNSDPMAGFGIIHQVAPTFVYVPENEPISDLCFCDSVNYYEELVYTSDIRSFIRSRSFISDSIDFFLVKGEVEYELDDDTYGTFYDFGSLTSHSNYKGYLLDFDKIYDELGYGEYYFLSRYTVLGVEKEFKSHAFNLVLKNENVDKDYILIETTQNGIISGGFDYSKLNWYQAIRLRADFDNSIGYTLNTDNTTLSETYNRKVYQGTNSIEKDFSLNIYEIPKQLSDFFLEDGILSDEIFISYTNKDAFLNFSKESVYFSEILGVETNNYNKFVTIKVKFKPERESLVKRRF
jgi:hypothetical protein